MIYYNSSIHFLWVFFFQSKESNNHLLKNKHMQTNCQQGTRKNNNHNLLPLLFKHKHPRLVKHQFSLSLSGSPHHQYFDFKEQKVITSAKVDTLVQFSSLNKLSKHCAHSYTGYFFIQMPQLYRPLKHAIELPISNESQVSLDCATLNITDITPQHQQRPPAMMNLPHLKHLCNHQ